MEHLASDPCGMFGANGQRHWLGYFATKTAAALAYNERARELFGEFAYLNCVPEAS